MKILFDSVAFRCDEEVCLIFICDWNIMIKSEVFLNMI